MTVADSRTRHRPDDVATLARVAAALTRQGLRPRDVGEILGIGARAAAALLAAHRQETRSDA